MLENRMESFFLAETIKYLYLLFDPDNFIHNTGDHGTKIQTPNGDCIIDTGSYIFNTEGHPIDTAALYCCSAEKKEDDAELQDFHDNLDLLSLLDIHDNVDMVQGVKWNSRKGKKKSEARGGITGDFKLGGGRLKSPLKGDHQNILSTEGKIFTFKDLNIPVVDLKVEGEKVGIDVSKQTDTKEKVSKDKDERSVDQEKLIDQLPEIKVKLKEIKISGSEESAESCDSSKPGTDCENSKESEKDKYILKGDKIDNAEDDTLKKDSHTENEGKIDHVLEETEEKYGLKLTDDMKSTKATDTDNEENVDDDDDDEDNDDDDSDDDDDSNNKDETEKHKSDIKKQVITLGHHGSIDLKDIDVQVTHTNVKHKKSNSGLETINEVMKLLKSMTTDILSDTGASVRTLHDKLKYYNLYKVSSPELMTCKAQPFYMRFSAMGEMFLEDK